MCEKCGKKYDSYKTSMRVVQQVDTVFEALTKPVLSKSPQSAKEWTEAMSDNEYIDVKAIAKRVGKYEKEWQKLFKKWKKRFNDLVKEKKGGMFGFFNKRELTQEDYDEILSEMFDEDEVEDMYYEMYVLGEMTLDHQYAVKKIAEKKNILILPLMLILSSVVLEDYVSFSQKMCISMLENARNSLYNIIVYGLEGGETTNQIVNKVNKKIGYYVEKEAKRIARTETIRGMNKGLESGFDRMGVDYYEILICPDACDICVEKAEGGPYKTLDKVGIAPRHPHCRCCILPIIK